MLSRVVPVVWLLAAACTNEEPGAPGERCNFDAPNSHGCDAMSVCLGGVCHLLCGAPGQSSPQCGGGACLNYTSVAVGWEPPAKTPTGRVAEAGPAIRARALVT